MELEWGKLAVDLLKTALWPVAAVIIALAFRKPIRAVFENLGTLLGRTQEMKFGDASIRVQQQATTIDAPKLEAPPAAAPLSGPSKLSAIKFPEETEVSLKPWLDLIRRDVDQYGPRGPEVLLVGLAQAQQRASFYQMLRVLFGSQLMLLEALNNSATGALDKTGIQQFHKRHIERGGGAPLLGWLAFLSNQKLITGDETRVQITPIGRDFVKFAGENNASPLGLPT